jgi:hypothetical protein
MTALGRLDPILFQSHLPALDSCGDRDGIRHQAKYRDHREHVVDFISEALKIILFVSRLDFVWSESDLFRAALSYFVAFFRELE